MIELIVVVGIIAILAGLLLPAVNHMRVAAQITGQKADFQTISSALEQYKADFGDYPRNTVLPTWNVYQTGPTGPTSTPAPIYLTLASALIGPGPLSTQVTGSGVYELGDGADGLGFAAQSVNILAYNGGGAQYTVTAVNFTSSPYTITLAPNLPPQLQSMTTNQSGSVTLSVGMYYEETVGFTVNPTTSPNQLILQAQPVFASLHQSGDKYLIKIPTARITPNYLSADNFKVAFILPQAGAGSGPGTNVLGPAGEPVILDRWGQVIQYFPRYGPASNRSSDSSLFTGIPAATAASVIAGPLYGYSEPKSIDANTPPSGQYAMYDFRDGAPFYIASNLTSPAQLWVAGNGSGSYWDPSTTLEWMLGNKTANTGNTGLTNYIAPPDKLNYDGPYILISAGPNGPSGSPNPNGGTNLGGYCSFVNAGSGQLTDKAGNNLTASEMLQDFTSSENVYNFDHP